MDVNVEAIYGLTPMQEGMLYHKFADNNDTSYHTQSLFWVNEEINIDIIRKTLDLLGEKHEVFRTAFTITKATGVSWQVVLKNRKVGLKYIEAYNADEKELVEEVKKKDLNIGFDLQNDSLFRMTIISFGTKRHIFMFSFHHIIMDGWCLSLVLGDFIRFLNHLSSGISEHELMKLVSKEKLQQCRYSEYIEWISKQDKEEGLNYWKDLLSDYEGKAEIKPIIKPLPTESQMNSIKTCLSKETTRELINLANSNNVTVNVIAEASWGIVLQKCNYSDDVVFGKVVSGRNVPIRGVEEKVGLFINSVPLRVKCHKAMTVVELIKSLYEQGIRGNSYEYCSLAEIQSLTVQGSELIKTMFVYENYYVKEDGSDNEENNLNIEFESSREQTNYSISVSFSMEDDQLEYSIMYNPNEFVTDEIKNISGWIKNTLISVAINPNSKVADIELITEPQKAEILEKFNNKYIEYENCRTIVEVFEEQVAKTPDNIAIAYGGEHITYRQFNLKVNSIAHKLRNLGVQIGDFIAIIAQRNIETLASIYGIIKAGAAYVPIDPEYPEERTRYILEDCKPKFILTDNSKITLELPIVDITEESIWEGFTENPDRVNKPNDLAYCIYTSGTTGKPKGVMVEHKGVPNLKNYFVNTLGITDKDSILQFANIVFDASVWEMTMALLVGAKLVIPTEEERKNNYEFIRLAEKEEISVATLPTIFYNNLKGFKPRLIITAGSEASYDIVKKAAEDSEYINAYGPTEFTVATTHWKYKNGDEITGKVPIGKAILNSQVYILNGMSLCGIGIPGELCMAGVGLARGYLNKPELTEEKFINNPFGKDRLYRSGDLARWLPDGNIEYLGRIDEQVKIRGFRIELGEIENSIRKLDYISDVAVIKRTDKFGEDRIYSYIVSEEDVSIIDVKKELLTFLPEYMIPTYIMQIDSIPVTINGKLDKKSLPEIEAKSEKEYVKPRNEVERTLCEVFCEILRVERVGIDDSFFHLGGDSLKAMKLVSKIRAKGYSIAINDVLNFQDVRNISKNLINYSSVVSKNQTLFNGHSFKNIEEAIEYLNKKIKAFSDMLINSEVVKSYPISPMQQLSLNKKILKSGIVLDFDHDVDMEKLSKIVLDFINSQELMRSTLTKQNDKIIVQLKLSISEIEIPIVDISDALPQGKKEFQAYMMDLMFGEKQWLRDELFDKLLYQVIAVKYDENQWKMYIPFCHLAFDGMSAEILRSNILRAYYNNGKLEISDKNSSYSEYVGELRKGPNKILEEEIIEKFNLEDFETGINQLKNVNKRCFVNSTIKLSLNRRATEFDEKELWNISYKLFNRMLCINLELDIVPFAVLFAERKYRNNSYYNTIGEFLDIVPISDSVDVKKDYDYVEQILREKEKHSINFTSFMYNSEIQEKYKRIGMIFKDLGNEESYLPVFNFLGLYNNQIEIEESNNFNETESLSMITDVTYSEKEIIIYGFFKKGYNTELINNLQQYLDELTADKIVI